MEALYESCLLEHTTFQILLPTECFDEHTYPIYGEKAINSYSSSHNNWCTLGGDGGCRIGKVWAGATSPMPDHKGFKLQ